MVAKSEAKEAPEAASEKTPAPTAPSAAPAAPAGRSDLRSWLLALTVIVLAPAASWATAQYVLLPHLRAQLNAPAATPEPAEAAKDKADGKGVTPPTYEFSNMVVNLAGTMGTRYLKTSFEVTGVDGLKGLFDQNKARLTDVTLNVLSSLTLADLEEPGSKNVLREKLVTAYNEALGRKIADQVYFSDFVVQ
jgi:flagellar FliL protein